MPIFAGRIMQKSTGAICKKELGDCGTSQQRRKPVANAPRLVCSTPIVILDKVLAHSDSIHRATMSKAKRRKKTRTRPDRPTESRRVEVLTVGWSMMVLMTLFCEIGAAGAVWYRHSHPEAQAAEALAALLLLETLVVGVLLLALTPVVVRSRREKPPRGIVVLALVVGAVPLVGLAVWYIAT